MDTLEKNNMYTTTDIEWNILHRIVMGVLVEEELESFSQFINENHHRINWERLIYLATIHKIICSLAYFLLPHLSGGKVNSHNIPTQVIIILEHIYFFNRQKIDFYRDEAIILNEVLTKNKINHAFLKGISFDTKMFNNLGLRMMNDVDILIENKYRRKVGEIMQNHHFVKGKYSLEQNDVEPFSRREIIEYELYPDHLPRFTKKVHGSPGIYCFKVDFSTSFTWSKCEAEINVNNVISNHIESFNYKENSLPCLSDTYNFLYTVLHLYREAWFEREIRYLKDVNLSKFMDIILLWRYHISQNESTISMLTSIIENNRIENFCFWVFKHTDEVFGTQICKRLKLEMKDEKSLFQYEKNGELKDWDGSMKERLIKIDKRQELFKE